MKNIEKILHKDESVLVKADISKTFYTSIALLYMLGFVLLFIGYEYEIGVIGAVLVIRTFYVNLQEIKEKKSYNCLLTQNRLIIVKGHKIKEIFPINLEDIRTIYIKPINQRLKHILDVGTIEVITTSGGRYVIQNIKEPYLYHKAIIGDVVSATHYSNKNKEKNR
ncbi:hypothetical protein SMGD1_2829 [Sulfurimonas gotlandica GD1]|jgi:hypothetical protein|uniref:DUF304 domain-containing protein n=1 Tax=Sulfurimonas gotlandica (strain DSM 19862 / JCM 16533 / GD1) TaxID=929558 RepID=B6BJV1_SULGG|nr:hypothetical protein [Sulfurimonas gotlandica]EDZ62631.1 hypothetical protein CBGD1_2198 [Sulfurimonas gotlandica GD1]EHP31351.1 hypothetical protein SMGD1_2829 [Sulfurimonas gotlandica GD1]